MQKFGAAYPNESQAQIFARFLSAKNAAEKSGRSTAPKKQLTFFDTAKFGNDDEKEREKPVATARASLGKPAASAF